MDERLKDDNVVKENSIIRTIILKEVFLTNKNEKDF